MTNLCKINGKTAAYDTVKLPSIMKSYERQTPTTEHLNCWIALTRKKYHLVLFSKAISSNTWMKNSSRPLSAGWILACCERQMQSEVFFVCAEFVFTGSTSSAEYSIYMRQRLSAEYLYIRSRQIDQSWWVPKNADWKDLRGAVGERKAGGKKENKIRFIGVCSTEPSSCIILAGT